MEYRKQERKEGKTRSRSDRKKERCWEKEKKERGWKLFRQRECEIKVKVKMRE